MGTFKHIEEWRDIWKTIDEKADDEIHRLLGQQDGNRVPIERNLDLWIDIWRFPLKTKEMFIIEDEIREIGIKMPWKPFILFYDKDHFDGIDRITEKPQNYHAIVVLKVRGDNLWAIDPLVQNRLLSAFHLETLIGSAKSEGSIKALTLELARRYHGKKRGLKKSGTLDDYLKN